MTKIRNSIVLITGGASGIGRLMGDMALQDGAAALVIWDINKDKLDQTTRELRALHFIVHPYLVDVSNPGQVAETAVKVNEEIGRVDILINNAGIITGNRLFREMSHEEIDRTLAVNTAALMHITLHFLPGMIEKGTGHIVNISSAAGLLANPRMSVYAASKWAVTGWSESLRIEQEMQKSGIRVTTVTPSYINTGMFSGVKTNGLVPLLKPEVLAARVIRAVKANRLLVRSPFMVRLLPFTKGVLPARVFDLVVGKWIGIYQSMQGFHVK